MKLILKFQKSLFRHLNDRLITKLFKSHEICKISEIRLKYIKLIKLYWLNLYIENVEF